MTAQNHLQDALLPVIVETWAPVPTNAELDATLMRPVAASAHETE